MSGSQRTSNIYAREALIEIDYGDLCEDLKVRFSLGGWGHLPSCPERSLSGSLLPLCLLCSLNSQKRGWAKTRGFHTQLDEGPETS